MSAYLEGSIAAVSMVGEASAAIKMQLLDGGAFFSAYAGSNVQAADGTVFTQLVNVGTAGVRFGILIDWCPMSVFAALKAAIDAALAGGDSFPVELSDDVHSISVEATPDYSAGNWISYPNGRLNGQFVRDVTLRLVSVD